MKKFFLSLVVAAMCVATVSAQDAPAKKETVIVDVFTMPTSANSLYRSVVKGIREKAIAAFFKTQRINVVDVTTEAFFNKAANDASSAAALDAALINDTEVRQAASKKFEAKYVIQGHVSHIQAVRKVTDDGRRYFAGEVTLSMKVVNLEDGTIAHAKDFRYAGVTGQTGDTDVAAVTNTANYLSTSIPRFVDTAFPVTGAILDIVSEKKGVAVEVYVNLGAAAGIKAKDKFVVYQVKVVAGNEMKTEVGELTVSEVGGDAISTCKVSKCGELICKSVSDPDKVKLVIISRPKANVGGGLAAMAKGMIN